MQDLQILKQLKKQNGLTNLSLAEKSGVPLGTINKIFSGSTKLSLENYNKLYSALTINDSIGKNYGFLSVALPSFNFILGDIASNTNKVIDKIKECGTKGADLIAFSELCLTGVTMGDLINQPTVFSLVKSALSKIAFATKSINSIVFVGAPILVGSKVYSCGVAFLKGKIVGVTPNEKSVNTQINLLGYNIPFGDNVYSCNNLQISCIVGEEYKGVEKTIEYSKNAVNVVVHMCGSKELVGLKETRETLIKTASKIGGCAYLFTCAGQGESTTDFVFGGQKLIAENGKIIQKTQLFTQKEIYSDIDLDFLINEKVRLNLKEENTLNKIELDFNYNGQLLFREFSQTPFIPTDKKIAKDRFEQILTMQALGLKRRLEHTYSKKAVIGISGGLDSTLALLVAVRCFKLMKKDTKDILGITMPCFGTSGRTYNNALGLCNQLGITLQEIKIGDSVLSHFKDIGQDKDVTDITYENSQARERTQVLMDMANKVGGMVVGTGDLSELALGWATYNGDHMSNYGVNGSIPKTLVRALCEYEANLFGGKIKDIIIDVIGTPVSPELKPPKEGEIQQKTEDLVGPYILHDFYLYYFLRKGYSPSRIFYLASIVFSKDYTKETIYRWLYTFIKRFFAMQFKRSCLPDGIAVGSVGVSPRGGLNMPSDMLGLDFIADLETVKPE